METVVLPQLKVVSPLLQVVSFMFTVYRPFSILTRSGNSGWRATSWKCHCKFPFIYLFIYFIYLNKTLEKKLLLTRIGKFVPVSSWGSFLQSKEKINNKKIPNIRFSCDNEVNSDIIYLFFTVRHLEKTLFFQKFKKTLFSDLLS